MIRDASQTGPDGLPGPGRMRLAGFDALRGVAIIAMASYHFAWDLGYFGLVSVDVAADEGWRLYARLIAASFLALVGASLVLARQGGFDLERYGARLARIVAAAILVSAATYAAFPDRFVWFGILHHIALASVLALPFLRLPLPLVAAAAVAAYLLPDYAVSEAFDHPWLWWTGLSPETRPANDFVPLFPWFSAVLGGIVAGRLAFGMRGAAAGERDRAPGGLVRPLAFAGRHSLAIYLLHQPLLFGVVMAVAAVMPMDAGIERARFVEACEVSCQETHGGTDVCVAFCGCVLSSLDAQSFWTDRPGEDEANATVGAAVAACRIDVAPEFLDEGGTE